MVNRPGLVRMTKVEVVVVAADAPVVRDLFTAAGVTGYTTVTGVSGMGHSGAHEGRLMFNDRAGLAMLITVLPDDRVDPILAGLNELFASHPGVVFVSDTYVSRPEYFTSGGT